MNCRATVNSKNSSVFIERATEKQSREGIQNRISQETCLLGLITLREKSKVKVYAHAAYGYIYAKTRAYFPIFSFPFKAMLLLGRP